MTEQQLGDLKSELDTIDVVGKLFDEVRALRANMQSTQERCNELLEDSRLKGRRIIVLEAELEAMRVSYDTGIIDLSLEINRPHTHRCVEDGHSFGHGDECFYCGIVEKS